MMRAALIPLGPVRLESTTLPMVRLEDLTKRPPSAAVAAAMLRNQHAILAALAVAEDVIALGHDAPADLRTGALWSVRRVRDLLGEK
mgnify:CR=1 FL=1